MSGLLGLTVKVNSDGYRNWPALTKVKKLNHTDELCGMVIREHDHFGYLVDFVGMGLKDTYNLHDGITNGVSVLKTNTGWWLKTHEIDVEPMTVNLEDLL